MDDSDLDASYGIGYKLLKRMGFAKGQGVGRDDNRGIVKPIESVVRPKLAGLGYAKTDEKKQSTESSYMAHPKEVDLLLEKSEKERFKGGYRELRAGPHGESSIFIVDKTGREEKLVSLPSSDVQKEKHPEIRHNLSLLMQQADGQLQKIEKESNLRRHQIDRSTVEKSRLQVSTSHQDDFVSLLDTSFLLIKSLKDSFFCSSSGEGPVPSLEDLYSVATEKLSSLGSSIERYCESVSKSHAIYSSALLHSQLQIVQESEESFEKFKRLAHSVLVSLFFPLYKGKFSSWIKADEIEWARPHLQLLYMLKRLSFILQDERYVLYFHKNYAPDESLYDMIFHKLWLPKVRRYISDPDWEVSGQHSFCCALEFWWPILSDDIRGMTAKTLLLPKISDLLSRWTLSADEDVSLYGALSPWMPFFVSPLDGSSFLSLSESVCKCIKRNLQDWHPSSPVALQLCSEWRPPLLDGRSFGEIVLAFISEKLRTTIKNEFSIDPNGQVLDPIEWLFSWSDILPLPSILNILERSFFPHFHSYLYLWLTSQPSYGQVREWYYSWKNLFPGEIASDPIMAIGFRKCIDMINELHDNPSLPLEYFLYNN